MNGKTGEYGRAYGMGSVRTVPVPGAGSYLGSGILSEVRHGGRGTGIPIGPLVEEGPEPVRIEGTVPIQSTARRYGRHGAGRLLPRLDEGPAHVEDLEIGFGGSAFPPVDGAESSPVHALVMETGCRSLGAPGERGWASLGLLSGGDGEHASVGHGPWLKGVTVQVGGRAHRPPPFRARRNSAWRSRKMAAARAGSVATNCRDTRLPRPSLTAAQAWMASGPTTCRTR